MKVYQGFRITEDAWKLLEGQTDGYLRRFDPWQWANATIRAYAPAAEYSSGAKTALGYAYHAPKIAYVGKLPDLADVLQTAHGLSPKGEIGVSQLVRSVFSLISATAENREKREKIEQAGSDLLERIMRNLHGTPDTHHGALKILIDPGTAPPEVVAEILADISQLYRLRGGSGITFKLEDVEVGSLAEVQ